MQIPTVGQKVRFNKQFEVDASMSVPIGATGVIDELGGDGDTTTVFVKLDQPYDKYGCDGGCAFYFGCEPPFEPNPLTVFWEHCEVIA